MRLKGECAIRNATDRGQRFVQVLFEREADSRKLAHALQARATGQCPGWASQRVFEFDIKVVEKIEEVLTRAG